MRPDGVVVWGYALSPDEVAGAFAKYGDGTFAYDAGGASASDAAISVNGGTLAKYFVRIDRDNGDDGKPIWITEIGWPTQKARLPAQNLFLAALKAARPEQKVWRVGYVGIDEDDA